jgi:hypothetical protein
MEKDNKEIIQDVIDRLLYLPEAELQAYKDRLNLLRLLYPIDMEEKNGMRVYHVTK